MIPDDNFTHAERSLLEEAYRLLGDNLSAFLLSGLGETKMTHRRVFAAQSVPGQGSENIYQLEMINDSGHGLPVGFDPLVMALLLGLLRKDMRMDDTVDISVGDILKDLAWPQSPESQLMIKQAVERYASTIFCLIEPATSDNESRSHSQRLLIKYEVVTKPPSVEASAEQLLMKVQFFPAFIYHIFTQRKSFLGIDFRQLQEIREIPV